MKLLFGTNMGNAFCAIVARSRDAGALRFSNDSESPRLDKSF